MPRPEINRPHSSSINRWPPGVYPGSASRGRYLVRVHRKDLMLACALARVGRDLVVLGERYGRWLQKGAPEWAVTPNDKIPISG